MQVIGSPPSQPIATDAGPDKAFQTAGARCHSVSRDELLAIGLILLVAACLRVAWIIALPVQPESDFATFYQMTTLIADGKWLPQSYGWTFGGPGYPVTLAPLLAAGGGLTAIRAANLAFQLGTIVAVWLLGRQTVGRRGGLAGAAIAGLCPGIWTFAPLVAAENLAMFLLVSGMACLAARRPGLTGITGACVAGLVITRPAYIGFPLVVVISLFLLKGAVWRHLAWLLAGMWLIAAPYVVLNLSNGAPALSNQGSSWQLWLVNNERSTGSWFPAAEQPDYPFKGIERLEGGAEKVAEAQQKLAIQFVLTNPQESVRRAVMRHKANWVGDHAGVFWTLDRAGPNLGNGIPLRRHLADIADRYFIAIIAAALVTVVRFRKDSQRLLPVVLPIFYAIPVLALAEANGRYHSVVVPFLCVLAGGAISPGRRLVWLILIVGSAVSLGRLVPLEAVLIILIAIVPLGYLIRTVPLGRKSRPSEAWPGLPRWGVRALAAAVIFVSCFAAVRLADRFLTELEAVRPEGWEAYNSTPGRLYDSTQLELRDSDPSHNLIGVSYPDAVELGFQSQPHSGDAAGVVRRLYGLRPGKTYLFYLQVFDPGRDGDPSETITVILNGKPIWHSSPDLDRSPAWNYLAVPWVADDEFVIIRVERTAGNNAEASARAVPMVRTLHLYPKY